MYTHLHIQPGLYSPSSPLTHYNAVECSPLEYFEGNTEVIAEAEWQRDPKADYFWSVYLHFDPSISEGRGSECVADFTTKESAQAYANGLELALRSVVGSRFIP